MASEWTQANWRRQGAYSVELDRGPWRDLLQHLREEIDKIAGGDQKVVVQIRRYISKRLIYDERGTPQERRIKKAVLFERQKGLCGLCGEQLELKRSELHRTHDAWRGYVVDGPDPNTILVHKECHDRQQEERGYR